MSTVEFLDSTGLATILNTSATLGNGARAAATYDNTSNLDFYGDAFLSVRYNTVVTAGTIVAELYLLPGNQVSTPSFPEGGDGTSGSNVDPQKALLVGTFESRNPSTSANEILAVPGIPISPRIQRFVIKNVGGQTWSNTWTLTLKPYKQQVV